MPLDNPTKLTRRRDLAFALETTTGTAATVGASQSVIPVFNPTLDYNTELVPRESNRSGSKIANARGARSGVCTFETELFGNETSALIDLFKCCGLTLSTATLTPTSQPTQTGTFGMYIDGRLKKLVGCMGTAVIRVRRGMAPRVAWSFTGVADQPSDTSLIAPTKVTTIAPRVGGTMTIGGTGGVYRTDELNFDLGNQVVLREDLTAVDSAGEPTGYRSAMIVDRVPRVTLAAEALALATRDWYDFLRDSTTAALSLAFGTTDNGYTLAAPKMELVADPNEGERNGMVVDNLQFGLLENSDAGDDEYTLTTL